MVFEETMRQPLVPVWMLQQLLAPALFRFSLNWYEDRGEHIWLILVSNAWCDDRMESTFPGLLSKCRFSQVD